MSLTQRRLKQLLRYDRRTGHFTWLVQRCGPSKKGGRAGYVDPSNGYRMITVDGTEYREHHLAWFYVKGKWPKEIDHRDMKRANNAFRNLRESTHSQNKANQRVRSDSRTGIKGVRQEPSGRYIALLANRSLGTFDTKEDAAKAYARAAKGKFGGFARWK